MIVGAALGERQLEEIERSGEGFWMASGREGGCVVVWLRKGSGRDVVREWKEESSIRGRSTSGYLSLLA